MLPPTYLETVDVVTRGAVKQNDFPPTVAGSFVGDQQAFLGGANFAVQRDEAAHYRLWLYVAIRRICDRSKNLEPNVGVFGRQPAIGQSINIGRRNVEHLRKEYGKILQDDAFTPLGNSHPMMSLVSEPNEVDTFPELLDETILHWKIHQEFFWWLPSNLLGRPFEWWAVPPAWVSEIYNKDTKELVAYKIEPDGDSSRKIIVRKEEMIHCQAKHPYSKTKPKSTIEAGRLWISNSEAVEITRHKHLENGPQPSLVLSLKDEKYKKPSSDELTEIKERFIARTAGIGRAGEPLVIPYGMEVDPWSLSPKEMDYQMSHEQLRDCELALMGVPNVVAGISKDYNRATADAANYVFCEVTINPLMAMIGGRATMVARRFDPRIEVWFPDCTPENVEHELKRDEADFKMGALTPDEIRSNRGREEFGLPESQTGYLPIGFTAIDPGVRPELPGTNPDQVDPPVPPAPPKGSGKNNGDS